MTHTARPRTADEPSGRFVLPNSAQLLNLLMQAFGYNARTWPEVTCVPPSASTIKKAAKDPLDPDVHSQFIRAAVSALLCPVIHAAPGPATGIEPDPVEQFVDGFLAGCQRWDRAISVLNNAPSLALPALLGALPILRIAAVHVGCSVGALTAAFHPDGSGEVKNPFDGNMFANGFRHLLERAWPGDTNHKWSTRLSGAIDPKTLVRWLGRGPGTFSSIPQVASRLAEQIRDSDAVTLEWLLRLFAACDRVTKKLTELLGEEDVAALCDHLIDTARRAYSVLTADGYARHELTAMRALLAAEEPVRSGATALIRQVIQPHAPHLAVESADQAEDLLDKLISVSDAAESRPEFVRWFATPLALFVPLPGFFEAMLRTGVTLVWLHDYLAVKGGDLGGHLTQSHKQLAAILASATAAPPGAPQNGPRIEIPGHTIETLEDLVRLLALPRRVPLHIHFGSEREWQTLLQMARHGVERMDRDMLLSVATPELMQFLDVSALRFDDSSAYEMCRKAQAHARKGEIDDALDAWQRAVQLQPHDPYVLGTGGRILFRLFLGYTAMLWTRAQDANPESEMRAPAEGAVDDESLAEHVENVGCVALQLFEGVLELQPDNDPAWYACIVLGTEWSLVLLEHGASDARSDEEDRALLRDSIQELSDLCTRNPDNGFYHQRLARVYRALGERGKARGYAKRAHRLGLPDEWQALASEG